VATKVKSKEVKYAILFKALLDKPVFFKPEWAMDAELLEAHRQAHSDFGYESDDFDRETRRYFKEKKWDILDNLDVFYREGSLPLHYFDSECLIHLLRLRADRMVSF
jgi:hypothetical protein